MHVADEGVGQHLDEAGIGEGAHDIAAGALTRGQARPRRRGGHDDGDAVVSIEAGDLLGEVSGSDQVRPPGGRSDGKQPITGPAGLIAPNRLHGAADGLQQLDDPLNAVGDAREALGGIGTDDDRLGSHGAIHIGGFRIGLAAAVLDQQVDRALSGDGSQLGVHAALVALGRLSGQLMTAGGASDRHRVEVGGLNEDVGSALIDLGVGTAEDAGQYQGSRPL